MNEIHEELTTPVPVIVPFEGFPKIPRLSRECAITEKIDGTNAQIRIEPDGTFYVGSRTRWITPQDDNFGFARWVEEHKEELRRLGPGTHMGEWWGAGIQRRYGLTEKRFSLFAVHRWVEKGQPQPEKMATAPDCCHVVPILYRGLFGTPEVNSVLEQLKTFGSVASPGFMKPEGVIVYHEASKTLFKKTIEGDEKPKGSQE
jgi:hypothetical protein